MTIRMRGLLCAFLSLAYISATHAQDTPDVEAQANSPEPITVYSVSLRALDKVTAKYEDITAPIGTVTRYGTLEIIARQCWQSPPDKKPESAALLDIWDRPVNGSPERVYIGWMFASSPSVSALEHPVYDITINSCTSRQADGDSL